MAVFGQFNSGTVLQAAILSYAAYPNSLGSQTLSQYLQMQGWTLLSYSDLAPYNSNLEADQFSTGLYSNFNAQAYVAYNTVSDSLALVFQGTVTGFDLETALLPAVHYGFLSDLIDAATSFALSPPASMPVAEVLVTGHSLGGEMAEFFASQNGEGLPPETVQVVTFGSPGIPFTYPVAQAWQDRILSVSHTNDPVYNHYGLVLSTALITYDQNGTEIEIDLPLHGNTFSPLDIAEHAIALYLGNITEIVTSGLSELVPAGTTIVAYDDDPHGYILSGGGARFVLALGGNDTIYGGAGQNFLAGGDGDDFLSGAASTDGLSGGNGNDTLVGLGDADTLLGGADDDLLLAGTGADHLEGGVGDDRLNGGQEKDTLVGGEGQDTLTGGGNSDRFIFDAGAATDAASGVFDVIIDYNQGNNGQFSPREGDTIDLSAIQFATDSGHADADMVRAWEDPTSDSSLLQINPTGGTSASAWITIAQLDGVHANNTLSLILDSTQTAAQITVLDNAGGSPPLGFDFPLGNIDSAGRRSATPQSDGDGYWVANEFGEFTDNPSARDYHLGEDWNIEGLPEADLGASVYAAADGTVVFAGDGGTGWGNVVIIRHEMPNGEFGGFVTTLYGHLGNLSVAVGDTVVRGEEIGVIGSVDGPSPHLHFEIRAGTNPDALVVGPGYSETPQPDGWLDPTDFISAHRGQVAPATWSISPGTISIVESDTSIVFTITRSSAAQAETVYASTTINHGSLNQGDYVYWNSEPVTFAVGQLSYDVTIQINDDSIPEGAETFGLIVQTNASDPVLVNLASATFTIQDNDTPVDPGPGVNFVGTTDDDSWTGTSGNDTASGLGGNDTLFGLGGHDFLDGGSDNDSLVGGDGNDQLSDSGGNDTLSGDDGNDTISSSGSGIDVINGGAGLDTLNLYRPDLTQSVTITPITDPNGGVYNFALPDGTMVSNVELLNLTTGSGDDQVTFANTTIAGQQFWGAGAGNDSAVVDFSAFSSVVTAFHSNNNPSIYAITTPSHQVSLFEVENLTIFGGSGSDSLTRITGNNTLIGNDGNDTLQAATGNDYLSGGEGDDQLSDSGGTNTLLGGAGNDTIVVTGIGANVIDGGSGNDSLHGGDGIDTANFSGTKSDYAFSLQLDGSYLVVGLDGTDTLAGIEFVSFGGGPAVAIESMLDTNDPPVADPDKTVTVDEDSGDTPLGITAPTDPDGDVLTITVSAVPAAAIGSVYLADGVTLVVVGNVLTEAELAGLVFRPAADANGSAGQFSYTVTDPDGASDSQTITLDVTPVNDAPLVTPANLEITVAEDSGNTPLGIAAPTDVDGDTLSVKVTNFPDALTGTVYLADGTTSITSGQILTIAQLTSLVFRPAPNASSVGGLFSYEVSDGAGGTGFQNVSILVTPVNDPPVTAPDTWLVQDANSAILIPAMAALLNDSDPENDALSITNVSVVSGPVGLSATLVGGNIQLTTPNVGANTPAVLSYTASDGANSTTGTINLTVMNQTATSANNTLIIASAAGQWSALDGLGGKDKLTGGAGNDVIYGNTGNDTITGGGGMDQLNGGTGGDTFIFNQGTHLGVFGLKVDGVAEQATDDILQFNNGGLFSLTDSLNISGIDVIQLGTNSAFEVSIGSLPGSTADANNDGVSGDIEVSAVTSIANGVSIHSEGGTGDYGILVDGTNFNGADSLSGAAGIDTLTGGSGNDLIQGAGGNDLLAGGQDNDTISGGEGQDSINGNAGLDQLFGDSGNDTLIGAAGSDTVTGGAGDDRIDVSTGNDVVRYTGILDGHDLLVGFDGNPSSGQDVFDLDALFDGIGVAAGDRAALVSITDNGSTVDVRVDADGNIANGFELFVATLNTTNPVTIGQDVLVGT